MKSVFGKPDRKNKTDEGSICSELPAWMMDRQIDSLGEDIDSLERDIEGGIIPSEDAFSAKQALGDFKERFDDIVISKPKYSPSEERVLQEELSNLNTRVSDTLYSRYDQLHGKGSVARPQREADFNDMPCIEINPVIVDICNLTGVKNGKVSRNQADKARKILCHYFGREDASREAIRPENNASRKRPMVGYTNERFAKRHEELYGKKKLNNLQDNTNFKSKIEGIREKFSEIRDQKSEVGGQESEGREQGDEGRVTIGEGNTRGKGNIEMSGLQKADEEFNFPGGEGQALKVMPIITGQDLKDKLDDSEEPGAEKGIVFEEEHKQEEKEIIKCPEEGCGFEGTANQVKGHKGSHVKAKKRAKILAG